jgi:hypothetical protein
MEKLTHAMQHRLSCCKLDKTSRVGNLKATVDAKVFGEPETDKDKFMIPRMKTTTMLVIYHVREHICAQ